MSTQKTGLAFQVIAVMCACSFIIEPLMDLLVLHNGAADHAVVRAAPTWRHLLGQNEFGDDIFLQALRAGRTTLSTAFMAAALATAIGTGIGVYSASAHRVIDQTIMRAVDGFLCIPTLPILLLLSSQFRVETIPATALLIAILTWATTAKITRNALTSQMNSRHIKATKEIGLSTFRLVHRHLAPSCYPIVLTQFATKFGNMIAIESGLSYLGFGMKFPNASWGNMLSRIDEPADMKTPEFLAPILGIIVSILCAQALADNLNVRNASKKP